VSALDYGMSASNREAILVSFAGASASTGTAAVGVPPVIPRGQLYYWSARWQTDLAHSREQLGAGEYREFEDGLGLVRWLLDED